METPISSYNETAASASTDAMLEQFRRYRATHDVALRDELICTHLPLVYTIARRYQSQTEPMDDIIQEGSIGLLKAVDYFDPVRGVRFSTYACHLITSQILHYLRDCGHLIRQPAWVQELNSKITRTSHQLFQQLGRDPLPAEIAREMGLTEEAVQEVFSARELNRIISLTAPNEEGNEEEILLIDKDKIRQARHQTLHLPIEDRIVLEEAIAQLKKLEQQVLHLFFFGNLTLSEIASRLSITTPRSAYLLRSSINKLKTGIAEQRQAETRLLGSDIIPDSVIDIPVFDKLTGVYSDSFFFRRVEQECVEARMRGDEFALVLIRIPGQYDTDDTASLLAPVGQIIMKSIHTSDLAAYLGDGQFGALLLDIRGEAHQVADRLCTEIAHHLHAAGQGTPEFSVVSGVALYPEEGLTAVSLLKHAQHCLATAHKATKRLRRDKASAVPQEKVPS